MLVATFGPSTTWGGKSITYEDGQFVLEGQGPITVWSLTEYDRQGHLRWAYDGLREWAYGLAGQAVPDTSAPPSPSTLPMHQPPSGEAAPVEPPAAESETFGRPAPRASLRWVKVAAVLALVLVAMAIAGGRLRDGFGIAFTVLAVAFLALLVWGALRPQEVARRVLPGRSARRLLMLLGGLCALCLVLAGVLWWIPHYEVVVPADKRVVLDGSPEMQVRVVNHGLFSGTYSATFLAGGVGQSLINVPLGPGESQTLTLAMPADVARGDLALAVGTTKILARVVAPPRYQVSGLEIDPAIAEKGQTISVSATVENSGDIAGTFAGKLTAGGYEIDAQPVKVAPGTMETLSYSFTPAGAGVFRLRIGDAEGRLAVVKPVRLRNGYVITRAVRGGRGSLTVKNRNRVDAMVVLTRSSNLRRPVLAVYVRNHGQTKVGPIPDGEYVFWDCIGRDWNWYMGDFYAADEHKRWRSPLVFSTSSSTNSWTTSWSDAWYIYTQRHSQTTVHWANWVITLGSGPSKRTKIVSTSDFPTP